jgi:hypothetical protein
MFSLVVAAIIVVVFVVRLLQVLLIMRMISTIKSFVFYMPLLTVGVVTHSYAFGPTYYRNGM